jgi:hypothetical protein
MPAANMHVGPQTDPKQYMSIHCPFGCTKAQHDEHMYCCHLMGFTKRMKKFEPIVRTKRGGVSVRAVSVEAGIDKDGDETISISSAIREILPTDVLVNPEIVQKDENGSHMTKLWPHFRVYRKISEEEARAWRAKYVALIEEDEESEMLEMA